MNKFPDGREAGSNQAAFQAAGPPASSRQLVRAGRSRRAGRQDAGAPTLRRGEVDALLAAARAALAGHDGQIALRVARALELGRGVARRAARARELRQARVDLVGARHRERGHGRFAGPERSGRPPAGAASRASRRSPTNTATTMKPTTQFDDATDRSAVSHRPRAVGRRAGNPISLQIAFSLVRCSGDVLHRDVSRARAQRLADRHGLAVRCRRRTRSGTSASPSPRCDSSTSSSSGKLNVTRCSTFERMRRTRAASSGSSCPAASDARSSTRGYHDPVAVASRARGTRYCSVTTITLLHAVVRDVRQSDGLDLRLIEGQLVDAVAARSPRARDSRAASASRRPRRRCTSSSPSSSVGFA